MNSTRLALLVVIFCTALSPVAADVIPTRASERDSGADAAAVGAQLRHMGLSEQQAADQLSRMAPGTLAYYARSPQALQVVGQRGPDGDMFSGESYNLWYETVIGIVVLGVVSLEIYRMVVSGD